MIRLKCDRIKIQFPVPFVKWTFGRSEENMDFFLLDFGKSPKSLANRLTTSKEYSHQATLCHEHLAMEYVAPCVRSNPGEVVTWGSPPAKCRADTEPGCGASASLCSQFAAIIFLKERLAPVTTPYQTNDIFNHVPRR